MKKLEFTVARVEEFVCEPGKQQTIFWDAKSPGFGLRVTAAGARAYIFESRLFGKTVRLTIGDTRTWELGKARTESNRLRGLVDNGIDPREHRAELQAAHVARQVEARRRGATFGDAWDEYVGARKPMWSSRHHRDHLQHAAKGGQPKKRGQGVTMAGPLASMRPLKLSELTGERISNLSRPGLCGGALVLGKAVAAGRRERQLFGTELLGPNVSDRTPPSVRCSRALPLTWPSRWVSAARSSTSADWRLLEVHRSLSPQTVQ